MSLFRFTQRHNIRRAAVSALLTLLLLGTLAGTASATPKPGEIVLPGASGTEGVAAGPGKTFFAGDLLNGNIFKGNVQSGSVSVFIHAPSGRMATGMKYDAGDHLLFVSGATTGQGYVYNTDTGATVRTYQFASPSAGTFINDVTLTRDGAWFTDSVQPKLYFVPFTGQGTVGDFRTLTVTGPASVINAAFNFNGIATSNDGSTLVVAHSGLGQLFTVDPVTGASALISGISVPQVDGILLRGNTVWAVQNSNQVQQIQVTSDLSSGTVDRVITSPLFEFPATAALFGNRLGVANAKFDTGFPPTASEYEIIIVS